MVVGLESFVSKIGEEEEGVVGPVVTRDSQDGGLIDSSRLRGKGDDEGVGLVLQRPGQREDGPEGRTWEER